MIDSYFFLSLSLLCAMMHRYNNQWMAVDYNKFTPGQTPQDGLLVILEQIP